MKISEIFYSIAGEIDIGKPAIFIRFVGCNMQPVCMWCDSKYSLSGGEEMSPEDIISKINEYPCKNIVITGGEAIVQTEELSKLLKLLEGKNYNIDIETNGLIYDKDIFYYIDNINCSPKKQLLNLTTLKKLCMHTTRFKFVYENKNDLWWEKLIDDLKINKKDIYIMPLGATKEEQESKMEEVIEYCKNKGYNFTPRLQALVWGSKKGK